MTSVEMVTSGDDRDIELYKRFFYILLKDTQSRQGESVGRGDTPTPLPLSLQDPMPSSPRRKHPPTVTLANPVPSGRGSPHQPGPRQGGHPLRKKSGRGGGTPTPPLPLPRKGSVLDEKREPSPTMNHGKTSIRKYRDCSGPGMKTGVGGPSTTPPWGRGGTAPSGKNYWLGGDTPCPPTIPSVSGVSSAAGCVCVSAGRS